MKDSPTSPNCGSQGSEKTSISQSQSSGGSIYLGVGRNFEKQYIRGSIDVMTPKVVATLDNCNISVRDTVRLISAIAEALNYNTDELILSSTSCYEKRKKRREELAERSKEVFGEKKLEAAVVHWDGKLMTDFCLKKKVDRVPVIVTDAGIEKILNYPALENGKGFTQAAVLYETLNEWGLRDTIKAICCDTTNANLGWRNGAAVLLKQKLKRDLLYLPCRHHIPEIFLHAAFLLKLPGTTGPNVAIFQKFRDRWDMFDHAKFKSVDIRSIPSILRAKIPIIEQDTKYFLDTVLPRDDYKELLLLTRVFLGLDKEDGLFFYRPGACHHARWMANAIYCLKMYIFREVYPLPIEQEKAMLDVCLFVVFVYISYWYRAPLPIMAPSKDLNLLKTLCEYRSVDRSLADSVLQKLENHLWYLSVETCALAFFDETIPKNIKRKMVAALKVERDDDCVTNKKYIINNTSDLLSLRNKDLDYFVNEKTLDFFARFEIGTSFLDLDVDQWSNNKDYKRGYLLMKNLKVVNDTAERAIGLVQEYLKEGRVKDEQQMQHLIQVVSDYKVAYPKATKNCLRQEGKYQK